MIGSRKRMPERIHLTGSPRSASRQLLVHLGMERASRNARLPPDCNANISSFLFWDEPQFKLNKGQKINSLYSIEPLLFAGKRDELWIFMNRSGEEECALSERLLERAFNQNHFQRFNA